MAATEVTSITLPFVVTAENNPSITSSDHRAMEGYWNLIDAILGGVEAMRAAGETYLPRFQSERKNSVDEEGKRYDPYQLRLKQTPFTAVYEDLALNLASKPFQKECTLVDGSPALLEQYAEDVDMQGNDLHVFSAHWFWHAINYAVGFVLVDHTRTPTVIGPSGAPVAVSLADERAAGSRPYWVFIPARRVLAAYTDIVRGRETLVHMTIAEEARRLDGFREYAVSRIRHLWRETLWSDEPDPVRRRIIGYGPPQFAVWESVQDATTQKSSWQVIEAGFFIASGGVPLSEIPVVWFVTGEREPGRFKIRPPLRSLAHMQVYEYQTEASLQNILNLTAFPMYAAQGIAKPDKTPVVGPRSVLYAPPNQDGNHGQWQILEPAGTSIEQVRKELDETRNQMRELGKQPLSQANLTVLTSSMVEAKANSVAEMWAILFQDACERAWAFTAEWVGLRTEDPKVFVHKDFGADMAGGEAFKDVLAMRTARDISRKATIDSAKRFSRLPDDFDADEDEAELAKESEAAQNESEIDPLTGRPVIRQQPAANGGTDPAQRPNGNAAPQ